MEEKLTILVADDEERMRKLLHDFLERSGYFVLEAKDGLEVVELFNAHKEIALILLDVMMPGMDGWEVLKEIRRSSKVPVMMITAKTEERDELRGFELGVDDYITKPFSPKVVMARVEAVLKRYDLMAENLKEIGGISIDKSARVVLIDKKPIELSFKEFELLDFFVSNPGVALSRERILNAVWDVDYYGDSRTIDTHVKKLRAKMGAKGEYIHTIWGIGYKFLIGE